MGRLITIFFLLISFAATSLTLDTAWAQAQQNGSELTGTRRQVATIIFSGLAGAILGLSTLSFYGRPQDHLNNVAIGGAVGIIVGTVYVTYKSATRPIDQYETASLEMDHQLAGRDDFSAAPSRQFQFSWEF